MFIGTDSHDQDVFYYDNLNLKNSNKDEILGITTDKKLTFRQHIEKCVIKQVPIKGKQYTLQWSNIS